MFRLDYSFTVNNDFVTLDGNNFTGIFVYKIQQSDPDTESLPPVLPDPWYPSHSQPEFPPDPAEICAGLQEED